MAGRLSMLRTTASPGSQSPTQHRAGSERGHEHSTPTSASRSLFSACAQLSQTASSWSLGTSRSRAEAPSSPQVLFLAFHTAPAREERGMEVGQSVLHAWVSGVLVHEKERPTFDVLVHPSQVLTEDAQADQLNAAEHQNGGGHRRPARNGRIR